MCHKTSHFKSLPQPSAPFPSDPSFPLHPSLRVSVWLPNVRTLSCLGFLACSGSLASVPDGTAHDSNTSCTPPRPHHVAHSPHHVVHSHMCFAPSIQLAAEVFSQLLGALTCPLAFTCCCCFFRTSCNDMCLLPHTTPCDGPKGCVCSASASLLWMSPHKRKADVEDGVALKEARRSKEATYPELCRGDGRARLVVIAGEVGGRWSQETKDFLWCLACEKSKSSLRLLQGSVRAGWYRRWCCVLACTTAKAVACSLVGHRGSPGSGDQVPSAHEVLTEARYLVS